MQALLTRVIACDSMDHLCVCQLMSISVWRPDQQPWVMQKRSFFSGGWIFLCGHGAVLLSAVGSLILFPLSRSAEYIKICDVREPERKRARARTEQKQERLKSWVFHKADTEVQGCNSFKDVFLFFPPVTELTPMVFDITRMTWWDYRCLFLVGSCLWYI